MNVNDMVIGELYVLNPFEVLVKVVDQAGFPSWHTNLERALKFEKNELLVRPSGGVRPGQVGMLFEVISCYDDDNEGIVITTAILLTGDHGIVYIETDYCRPFELESVMPSEQTST